MLPADISSLYTGQRAEGAYIEHNSCRPYICKGAIVVAAVEDDFWSCSKSEQVS